MPLCNHLINNLRMHPCCNKINLGLCCINSTLNNQKPPITTNRSAKRKFSVTLAQDLAKLNVADLKTLIHWNYTHNIKCFRISCDIFPRFTDLVADTRYNNPVSKKVKIDVLVEHKTDTIGKKIKTDDSFKIMLDELTTSRNTMDNMEPNYKIDFMQDELKQAGQLAMQYQQRIVMHSDPSSVVGTLNEGSFIKTCRNLHHYAQILDFMGIPTVSQLVCKGVAPEQIGAGVIITHGGGLYIVESNFKKPTKPTGKNATPDNMAMYRRKLTDIRLAVKILIKRRWIENFHRLPDIVRGRLVIENDEDDFNITDCLEIAEACHIPMVLDFFHQQCFQERHYFQELDPEMTTSDKILNPEFVALFHRVIATWKNTRPLFHISERIPGISSTDKLACKHSDYITKIPEPILELFKLCPTGVDLEVEAKAKELAIFHLWKTQPELYSYIE